jgi:transcriptional regulator with XRE-family HTH domain
MTGLGPERPGDVSPAGPGNPSPSGRGDLGPEGTGKRRPRPLLRTTIGEVLRRTRREQGRSLADVARAARVSVPYLSEVERGRKEASSEVLAAICDALRIGLADLLAGTARELAGTARELAGTARELAGDPGAVVIRLGSVDGGGTVPPRAGRHPRLAGGQGDVVCLAA